MKKAMLFMIALLFSFGAHAASISIDATGSSGVTTQPTTGTNTGWPSTGITYYINSDTPVITANIFSDIATAVKVSWSVVSNGAATATATQDGSDVKTFTGFGYSYITSLLGGANNPITVALKDINPLISGTTVVGLNVSAVPVPAALWLFAPALLGFFGLRRKSSSQALVAA